jgi:hypothetical protein
MRWRERVGKLDDEISRVRMIWSGKKCMEDEDVAFQKAHRLSCLSTFAT